jgi:two-component system chemotaxis sensor kinase CheA
VGEETELDKNLIEAIGDPLTHLVRNSIDHGLEGPDERLAAGKSEVGMLTISAFQEGGSIVIEVADDGRGLSREKILSKAVMQGLVSNDDSLTDDQVYNLCFQPGFSTAEKVTDLSGRGVGMDIVKQSIGSFGGAIKVTSRPGHGVSTRIRLPLTMAILEGQSMSVSGGVYIVPLTSILESIRPRQEDVHHVAQLGEVVTVRGEYLPVVRLHEVFGFEPTISNLWEGSLVLVEGDGRKVALFADELIGQGQIVIKSLESNYKKVFGIAGATILGDGRVALIIDVPGLIRGMTEEAGSHLAAA